MVKFVEAVNGFFRSGMSNGANAARRKPVRKGYDWDRSNESMHIALVTPRLIRNDGQGRVNLEIVKPLLASGVRVTALTSAIDPELQRNDNFRWIPMGIASLPTSLLRSQLFSFQSSRWLNKHRDEFDVIHADGSVTLFPSDINTCHFVHGAWARSEAHTSRYNRNAYGLYHWVLTMLDCAQERVAYSRAKHIVAVSGQVKQQLVSIGVPAAKISVICNGIDVSEFSPGSGDRKTFGLPPDAFIALFAGDMKTPRKNMDTILESMLSLPDVHLAAAGELRGNPYQEKAVKLGLEHRVHFVGFRRDLADLMKVVDAFVYPARYEPLGLVVLEALASGLPVVTSRTTGASELIDDRCGLVIDDPNDARALADALGRIVRQPQLRVAMGASARQLALRHTWQNMAQEYAALYHLIGQGKTVDGALTSGTLAYRSAS